MGSCAAGSASAATPRTLASSSTAEDIALMASRTSPGVEKEIDPSIGGSIYVL